MTVGPADDVLDADGEVALNFSQAQEKARAWFAEQATSDGEGGGQRAVPCTVRQAMKEYLDHYRAEGKSLADTQYRIDAFILPKLGDTLVEKLAAARIRQWLNELAARPPRLRTRPGEKQNYREFDSTDPEAVRRRRSSANRTLTVFKAALNFAFHEGRVASDVAWRQVQPFRNADSARVRYLDVEESSRLVNACAQEFRALVQGALLTGCRYGELTALRVRDFSRDARALFIERSKSGKTRHVYLTDDGLGFFSSLCAGRDKNAFVFPRSDGQAWGRAHQHRPLRDACGQASINPPITFHGLRHTYASHAVMNGVPLQVVAENLGHADTRMCERHYAHLAPSYRAEQIRAAMPTLGDITGGSVVRIGRRRLAK